MEQVGAEDPRHGRHRRRNGFGRLVPRGHRDPGRASQSSASQPPPPASIHGKLLDERTPNPEAARAIEILSHELRSPLTSLHLGTKVLRQTEGTGRDEVRQEVVEVLELEAERLFRLVEDLIAVARHEGRGAPLPVRPLLLQRWLPGVVETQVGMLPGVRVRLAIDPATPAIAADDGALDHVIRNLLVNAGRVSPAGLPVEVVVEPAGPCVLLRVLDRGPGIDPGEAEQLFEPFYRSPRTVPEVSGGAGLGLAAARRLLRAMGATIEARPRDGGGADLRLLLPRAPADPAE